jgi:hypothetical protein
LKVCSLWQSDIAGKHVAVSGPAEAAHASAAIRRIDVIIRLDRDSAVATD